VCTIRSCAVCLERRHNKCSPSVPAGSSAILVETGRTQGWQQDDKCLKPLLQLVHIQSQLFACKGCHQALLHSCHAASHEDVERS